MQKVEARLKDAVHKVLHPREGDIDGDKLEKFLMDMIDTLESRANDKGSVGAFEGNVQTLVGVCAKLWEEKERWYKKYNDMADRYNKHLDKDIETYNSMLNHRGY